MEYVDSSLWDEHIDDKIIRVMANAVEIIRENTPIDTGNLRYNSIKLERVGTGQYSIYVDENIAPYAPITNAEWESKVIKQGTFQKGGAREVFRNWGNLNEGWWERAVRRALDHIEQELGGSIKEE